MYNEKNPTHKSLAILCL